MKFYHPFPLLGMVVSEHGAAEICVDVTGNVEKTYVWFDCLEIIPWILSQDGCFINTLQRILLHHSYRTGFTDVNCPGRIRAGDVFYYSDDALLSLLMFITEENHWISCYIFLYNTARLWYPLYITTPSYFWPWARSVRKRISDLFFWDKNTRHRTLHYCDTMYRINAIILIIIVILSPHREAHYPDLPPFA